MSICLGWFEIWHKIKFKNSTALVHELTWFVMPLKLREGGMGKESRAKSLKILLPVGWPWLSGLLFAGLPGSRKLKQHQSNTLKRRRRNVKRLIKVPTEFCISLSSTWIQGQGISWKVPVSPSSDLLPVLTVPTNLFISDLFVPSSFTENLRNRTLDGARDWSNRTKGL